MIDNPGQTGLNFVHCKKLNFHQAETEFSQLVDLAASGDEILIAGSGNRLPIGLLWIQGQDPRGLLCRSGVSVLVTSHVKFAIISSSLVVRSTGLPNGWGQSIPVGQ
jgi:hypothetical protein